MRTPYVPKQFFKNAASNLRYQWRWAAWLTQRGLTIDPQSVTVVCPGLTVTSVGVSGTTVHAYVSGGVIGDNHEAICTITAVGGPAPEIVSRKIRIKLIDM